MQEPTPEQMKQDWDTAKETLLQQKRKEFEGLYVENLRDRLEKEGKIKINKKEMERLSQTSEGVVTGHVSIAYSRPADAFCWPRLFVRQRAVD